MLTVRNAWKPAWIKLAFFGLLLLWPTVSSRQQKYARILAKEILPDGTVQVTVPAEDAVMVNGRLSAFVPLFNCVRLPPRRNRRPKTYPCLPKVVLASKTPLPSSSANKSGAVPATKPSAVSSTKGTATSEALKMAAPSSLPFSSNETSESKAPSSATSKTSTRINRSRTRVQRASTSEMPASEHAANSSVSQTPSTTLSTTSSGTTVLVTKESTDELKLKENLTKSASITASSSSSITTRNNTIQDSPRQQDKPSSETVTAQQYSGSTTLGNTKTELSNSSMAATPSGHRQGTTDLFSVTSTSERSPMRQSNN